MAPPSEPGPSEHGSPHAGPPQAGAPHAGPPQAGAGDVVPAGAGSPPGAGPAIRASDRERDAVLRRLQDAFAEGRLDDDEFDGRMRSALAARTRDDLDRLLADLPSPDASSLAARGGPAAATPAEGRLAVAIKGSVRRGGRWRVPDRLTTFAYKGASHLDLRAAELTAPVTAIRAVAYKSDVEVVVPPGVRVVTGGFGVSREDDEESGHLAPDAPVVHVRGFAYKGRVEIRTRPRSR